MGVGGNPPPFGLVAVNDDHHRRILRFRQSDQRAILVGEFYLVFDIKSIGHNDGKHHVQIVDRLQPENRPASLLVKQLEALAVLKTGDTPRKGKRLCAN